MICSSLFGARLSRILPALLSVFLLFSVSANSHADSETEDAEYLNECLKRLETTTNELETSMELLNQWKSWSRTQNELITSAMTLSNGLIESRRQDAKRFETIETLLNELETEARNNWLKGAGVGSLIGAITAIILTM